MPLWLQIWDGPGDHHVSRGVTAETKDEALVIVASLWNGIVRPWLCAQRYAADRYTPRELIVIEPQPSEEPPA